MENSFFIYSDAGVAEPLKLERFHICTWEFKDDSSLVEFGFEVCKESLVNINELVILLFIPWLSQSNQIEDLYDKLSNPENSRFIFNDSIVSTDSLDGGLNKLGVIQRFRNRDDLCILPSTIETNDCILKMSINLQSYVNINNGANPQFNVYSRVSIKLNSSHVSMRKRGVNKSAVIYDIRINEKRNIPQDWLGYFADKSFCEINHCFLFNIIPNKYDFVFHDSSTLKSVRALEYNSFKKYISDKRVKSDELLVIFHKKEHAESFSFFSIYSKERIGAGQFALALFANILCGVLLFIPGFRKSSNPELSIVQVWSCLPIEVFVALAIAFITLIYFIWPAIINIGNNIFSWWEHKKKKS